MPVVASIPAAFGAAGGPGWRKVLVSASSGVESRNVIGSPSGSVAGTANVHSASCGQITIGGIVDTGELFVPAPARTIVCTL